ncbi:MAG: 50S ribosomal protein L21 [Candidatus Omnitrophica bacterium ADurb.Bin277]|nr:MAG: 50S ribosomal protein L21 [Candidatus Omnitrophica bacterium ADurb.Bin277]
MSIYAIVETGSKQYWVEPKSVLDVELLEGAEGQKEVVLDRVLFFTDGAKTSVGTPVVKGARVVCENLGAVRAPKVIHYRMRRRKASRRKHGHRQELLRLLVKEIKA